MTLEMVFARW